MSVVCPQQAQMLWKRHPIVVQKGGRQEPRAGAQWRRETPESFALRK